MGNVGWDGGSRVSARNKFKGGKKFSMQEPSLGGPFRMQITYQF
jgi:hypothetical protein